MNGISKFILYGLATVLLGVAAVMAFLALIGGGDRLGGTGRLEFFQYALAALGATAACGVGLAI